MNGENGADGEDGDITSSGFVVRSFCRRSGGFGSTTSRLWPESGSMTIELAIIFPLLILTVMLIFQSAFYWHAWNTASLAAEQGVAAGQILPAGDSALDTEARAAANIIMDQTGGLEPGSTVAVTNPTPRTVQVTVTVTPIEILPASWLSGANWTVEATAEGRLEEFIGADQR